MHEHAPGQLAGMSRSSQLRCVRCALHAKQAQLPGLAAEMRSCAQLAGEARWPTRQKAEDQAAAAVASLEKQRHDAMQPSAAVNAQHAEEMAACAAAAAAKQYAADRGGRTVTQLAEARQALERASAVCPAAGSRELGSSLRHHHIIS
eukprot:gene12652-biopygen9080